MALGLKPIEIIDSRKFPMLGIKSEWNRVNVSDIAHILNGYAFKSNLFNQSGDGKPLIRIRDVGRNFTETFFNGDWDESYLVRNGDILIGMDGDFKCSIWRGDDALLNQRVCKISVNNSVFDKQFFVYLMQPYLDAIHTMTSAVTVKHLSSRTIQEIPLPNPPLPEQRAIVAKIEAVFAELDEGVRELKAAKAQLKTYRQSVLKAAFEGKLTEEWREKNPKRHSILNDIVDSKNKWIENEIRTGNGEAKRLKSKLSKHSFNQPENWRIPNTWEWTSLLNGCHLVVDCHNKTAPYVDTGIYLMRTSNIRDGQFKLDGVKYVDEPTFEYWSRRCPPKENDILFTREAPMGEAAIIPKGMTVCMGQRIMLLRVFQEYLKPQFLLHLIMSPNFQRVMMNSAIGTGVKHLRVGDVESLSMPICSFEEQTQIVQEIETRLGAADEMEKAIDEALAQSETLRQSVLKKAFEGRLVEMEEPNLVCEACGFATHSDCIEHANSYCEPAICGVCNELYDINTEFFGMPEEVNKCTNCGGYDIQPWDSEKCPCPRCGEKMEIKLEKRTQDI